MKLKKLNKTTSANFASVEMFVVICETSCYCGCACGCTCVGNASYNTNNVDTAHNNTGNTTASGKSQLYQWG